MNLRRNSDETQMKLNSDTKLWTPNSDTKGVPHLQISVNLLVPVKKARKTGGVFGGQNLKNEEKLKKKFQKFLLSQIVR